MPVRPRTAPAPSLHVKPQLCEQPVSLLRPDAFPNLDRQNRFGEGQQICTVAPTSAATSSYLRAVLVFNMFFVTMISARCDTGTCIHMHPNEVQHGEVLTGYLLMLGLLHAISRLRPDAFPMLNRRHFIKDSVRDFKIYQRSQIYSSILASRTRNQHVFGD